VSDNGRDHHHSKLITRLRITVDTLRLSAGDGNRNGQGISARLDASQKTPLLTLMLPNPRQLSDYEIIAEYFRSLKQIEIVC
jgi:hypothetical protein